jgi:hypothetical protein
MFNTVTAAESGFTYIDNKVAVHDRCLTSPVRFLSCPCQSSACVGLLGVEEARSKPQGAWG